MQIDQAKMKNISRQREKVRKLLQVSINLRLLVWLMKESDSLELYSPDSNNYNDRSAISSQRHFTRIEWIRY